jgi:hypothetical protein
MDRSFFSFLFPLNASYNTASEFMNTKQLKAGRDVCLGFLVAWYRIETRS